MDASHPTPSWWTRLAALAGLVLTATLLGALGIVLYRGVVSWWGPSGAEDWGRHPLEIVAEGSQGACMLNVDALAPGNHDVLVVAADSPSRVRIEDPSGNEIFRADKKPVADTASRPAATEPPTAEPVRSISLDTGIYRVVCEIENGPTATVPLRVRPADELD